MELTTNAKRSIVGMLIAGFAVYTFWTDFGPIAMRKPHPTSPLAAEGKLLLQRYNCQTCHQIYGLGGFMGPDLTNVYSAPGKGPQYIAAFLENGTGRMPNFHLSTHQVSALIAYLASVDATGTSPLRRPVTTWYGALDVNAKPQ